MLQYIKKKTRKTEYIMLISLNINANDTTTENIQNQITEIIETLKHAQQLLNSQPPHA